LYGFTRFEPAALANDDLEDVGLAVEGAPLARNPSWLPAIEQFGEGIFILLNSDTLGAWLARSEFANRASALADGVARWVRARRQRGLQADASDLGIRGYCVGRWNASDCARVIPFARTTTPAGPTKIALCMEQRVTAVCLWRRPAARFETFTWIARCWSIRSVSPGRATSAERFARTPAITCQ
jgi:hypothetical protein